MNKWESHKLGDVITSNNQSVGKEYLYDEILYLDTGSITCGKIDSFQKLSIADAPSRAKRLVKNKDIVYSTVRPIQRHYGFIEKPLPNLVVSTGFSIIETNQKLADPLFIYNFLISDEIVETLDIIADGSTSAYPSLKPSDIENLEILLPPLPEQKAITSVLSSLDDKIDRLHRQNKTLEAMAETLFRQWFVEEARDDWEEKPLSFFGEIICGKTPSKKIHSYFNGEIPFIKIPDMHGNTFLFETSDSLTEEGKKSQDNKTLPAKSICVSCIATVGLVSMNAKVSQTNQQINSIIPNKEYYRYFLYLLMKSYNDLLHSMASGGTATLNLNTGNFSKIPIPSPGDKFLAVFQNQVEPFFDKIFINQSQIRTLEKLRDTLLPKLMNGEVRVKI
ncbi:MAG: restriction endonuclease subunit S [Desulfobacterales bacterium]|nr:restriction endonuclease subunit S [Desulfobacterales bacterium]